LGKSHPKSYKKLYSSTETSKVHDESSSPVSHLALVIELHKNCGDNWSLPRKSFRNTTQAMHALPHQNSASFSKTILHPQKTGRASPNRLSAIAAGTERFFKETLAEHVVTQTPFFQMYRNQLSLA